jgi:hypothetical protein
LDRAGKISGPAQVFECQNDDAAQTIASTLNSDHDGVEVWAGTRRVARLADHLRHASTYVQIDARTVPATQGQGKSISVPTRAQRENRRILGVKVVLTRLMHRWTGTPKPLGELPKEASSVGGPQVGTSSGWLQRVRDDRAGGEGVVMREFVPDYTRGPATHRGTAIVSSDPLVLEAFTALREDQRDRRNTRSTRVCRLLLQAARDRALVSPRAPAS